VIGEILENKSGQKYVVLATEGKSKSNNQKWRIRFLDTGYETVVEKVQMKRGKIKDRFARDILGVGYIGNADVVTNRRSYNIWHKMLRRCYDVTDNSYINYGGKGVTVAEEWCSFEQFVKDIPLIDGYDQSLFEAGVLNLDKDMKQMKAETKIYSLNTCTFLTKTKNSAIVDRTHLKKEFEAISPSGERLVALGIREFARNHGLIKQGITSCLQGRTRQHKGWTFRYL